MQTQLYETEVFATVKAHIAYAEDGRIPFSEMLVTALMGELLTRFWWGI
jgi:hypothetical protein